MRSVFQGAFNDDALVDGEDAYRLSGGGNDSALRSASGGAPAITTGEMTGSRALEFDAHYTANVNGYVGASDAEFLWDFGDGAMTSCLHAMHTYANSADCIVVLTVLHHNGTSDTARMHTVAVNDVADVNGSIASLHDVWS